MGLLPALIPPRPISTNFVAAADPASKVAYQFVKTGELSRAIQDYGYIPIRADGTPFKVQKFEGGYLLDGAPINVWMGEGWYQGQQELLTPFWQTGEIPRPPDSVMGVSVRVMPAETALAYQQYKSRSGFDVSTIAIAAAVAFLAWKFLR